MIHVTLFISTLYFKSRACYHIGFLQPLSVIIMENALKGTLWKRQVSLPIRMPKANVGDNLFDLFYLFGFNVGILTSKEQQ